eukprot:3694787-Amphidinium_carterae.1
MEFAAQHFQITYVAVAVTTTTSDNATVIMFVGTVRFANCKTNGCGHVLKTFWVEVWGIDNLWQHIMQKSAQRPKCKYHGLCWRPP